MRRYLLRRATDSGHAEHLTHWELGLDGEHLRIFGTFIEALESGIRMARSDWFTRGTPAALAIDDGSGPAVFAGFDERGSWTGDDYCGEKR